VNRCGYSSIAASRSVCSPAALPLPPADGPCVIPSSARVETSFMGRARTCGNGEDPSPVPALPNAALFAGVSGTRISVPSSEHTRSRPALASRQSRSPCSRREAPSTMLRSSSAGPGPSALRQSPSARSDGASHRRDHGTIARSPASAMTASRMPASGISVISTMTRIMNAAVSSRSRSPFTNRESSTARSAASAITPGPACDSSHSSSGPRVACTAGLPLAWTRPSRRTTAGATATMQNTVTSPDRIRSVPPMTSADRSPAPSAVPSRSGDATSSSRKATSRPSSAKPSRAPGTTGYKDTRGSCEED
jgi:hypothetical protein